MTNVQPHTWRGGAATDYVVERGVNGGLGTRHVPSNSYLPHVRGPSDIPGMSRVGPDPVGIANLVLNVANLGIGVFNAYQLHKLAKSTDALREDVQAVHHDVRDVHSLMSASVFHLDQLVTHNTALLATVLNQQGQLADAIGVLHADLHDGLGQILDAIDDLESRALTRELEVRLRTMLRYYNVCAGELEAGRTAPDADLRKLVETATAARAWIEGQLERMPMGAPERMPMLTAVALTIHLEGEARSLLGHASGASVRDRRQLADRLSAEIRAMTDNRRIAELSSLREWVERYILLRRVMLHTATVVATPEGRLLPMYADEVLTWDDGLDTVAVLASPTPCEDDTPIELEDLDERRAWRELGRLPRTAVGMSVPRDQLAAALGITGGTDEELRVGLREGPAAQRRFATSLTGELSS